MCGGPTATQENLQQEEADFYQQQTQAYQTAYANYTEIADALNAQFAPIVAAGPNQFGFNQAEVANLDTQAIQGTATQFNNAEKTLNEETAAEGGGNTTTNQTSGETQALRESLAATGATTESGELEQIQQAGYTQGYNEYENAVEGEESVAAGWNPNSFATSANNSAGAANSEANAIAQEQDSVWTSVLGALGGVAGAAVGNLNVGPFKS